jgi:hypothetical protein
MSEEQRTRCEALMSRVRDAGMEVWLHEFRSISGCRVIAGDGGRRRFTRDGDDPEAMLRELMRLLAIPAE